MNDKIKCIECGEEAEEIFGGGYKCNECGFIIINQNLVKNESK